MAALADPHAPLVGDVPIPDRAVGVQADPVGDAAAQVGMGDQRPVWLPAQQTPVTRRHDQQTPIWQPADACRHGRDAGDDLAGALQIDGDHLIGAHVGEPQTVLVPPGRLAHRKTGQQGLRFRHWRLLGSGAPVGAFTRDVEAAELASTARSSNPSPAAPRCCDHATDRPWRHHPQMRDWTAKGYACRRLHPYRSDRIEPHRHGGLDVRATDPTLLSTLDGQLTHGTFLNQATGIYPTTVLGHAAAQTLDITDLTGTPRVWLGGHWYTVIGILCHGHRRARTAYRDRAAPSPRRHAAPHRH